MSETLEQALEKDFEEFLKEEKEGKVYTVETAEEHFKQLV